jgi:phenylalanyl-tRNA synthetase beta chain
VFHYDAVDPDGLRFVPLGYSPNDPDAQMTPREILEKHKTGQAYAHLLKPLKKYPLLRDGGGHGALHAADHQQRVDARHDEDPNFFVDVTGLSQRGRSTAR